MWIRSQDKYTLINAKCIEIDKDNNLYKIYAWSVSGAFFDIATYSTEEVALRVLNSIEEELCDGNDFYQMPEEIEVEDDE